MDKDVAETIKLRGENAIRELVSILDVDHVKDRLAQDELEALKRGIGLSIGRIDTELLSIAYKQYPEIDPISKCE
jgi:hypothetical protein